MAMNSLDFVSLREYQTSVDPYLPSGPGIAPVAEAVLGILDESELADSRVVQTKRNL
jgi:hypothetical protein